MSPAAITVPTGAQQQFSVVGSYSDNTTTPITTGIEWSSSNPSVANSSGLGFVSCTSDSTRAGTTTIVASYGGFSAQATVTVTPAALTSVTVEPSVASVAITGTQSFTAIGHYSDNSTATLVDVTWSTSNGNASVDPLAPGFAKGVTAGTATITATDNATGKSGAATLTITLPVLQSISISPATATLALNPGFTQQFTASGHYSDGSNQDLKGAGVVWSSTNAHATVNGSGLATGTSAGPETITVDFGGFTASAALTVIAAIPVTPVACTGPACTTVGPLAVGGALPYVVHGLAASTEYLVRFVNPTSASSLVEGYTDLTFGALACSTWPGGPPCRTAATNGAGDLLVFVTGVAGGSFTLDVRPLPVFPAAGGPIAGNVDGTETYLKVEGLTPATLFGGKFLSDPAADLFVYDRNWGPFGFTAFSATAAQTALPGWLCSTVGSSNGTKDCVGFVGLVPPVPAQPVPASGTVYVTVEGWLTAGTSYTLTP